MSEELPAVVAPDARPQLEARHLSNKGGSVPGAEEGPGHVDGAPHQRQVDQALERVSSHRILGKIGR